MMKVSGHNYTLEVDASKKTISGDLGNLTDAGWFWDFDEQDDMIYLALYRFMESTEWDDFEKNFIEEANQHPEDFKYFIKYLRKQLNNPEEQKELAYAITGDNAEYKFDQGMLQSLEEDMLYSFEQDMINDPSLLAFYAERECVPLEIFEFLVRSGLAHPEYIEYTKTKIEYLDENFGSVKELDEIMGEIFSAFSKLSFDGIDSIKDIALYCLPPFWNEYLYNYGAAVLEYDSSINIDLLCDGPYSSDNNFFEILKVFIEGNEDNLDPLKAFINYYKKNNINVIDSDFYNFIDSLDISEYAKDSWKEAFVQFYQSGAKLLEKKGL